MTNDQIHGYDHHGLSLLGGWLPWTVQLAVAIVILLVVGRRTRRWLMVWLSVSAVAGLLVMFAVMCYATDQGVLTDPAPNLLWVWITVTGAMMVIVVAGWRGISWWRRGLSVLAVPLSVVCVALVLNQWVGYYPTVQAAWGAFTAGPVADQTAQSALPSLQGKGATMDTGRVVAVTIPETASHFPHREEYVYLPPVWFAGPQHPALPVIMMIGGEYNTPADWMRTGDAQITMDHYAQAHQGYAPILVFVDAGGTINNDTECVNGPRGNVADHLTSDVRPYVISQFGAPADPAKWGIVGWSMGGTCATDLALMHPDLFSTFEDIAGDVAPNTGTRQQTIQRLFGGNAAAYASYDPLTILARHPRYPNTAGWFADSNGSGQSPGRGHGDGAAIANTLAAARQLCAAGAGDGIQCAVHVQGGGHTWQFASQAFAEALPWMDARFHHAPGASSAPLSRTGS